MNDGGKVAGRKEREIALLDTESIFTYKRLEWVECSNSGKACVFDLRLMHDQACQARLTKDLVVLKSSNLYALQVFSLDVTENQPLNPHLNQLQSPSQNPHLNPNPNLSLSQNQLQSPSLSQIHRVAS